MRAILIATVVAVISGSAAAAQSNTDGVARVTAARANTCNHFLIELQSVLGTSMTHALLNRAIAHGVQNAVEDDDLTGAGTSLAENESSSADALIAAASISELYLLAECPRIKLTYVLISQPTYLTDEDVAARLDIPVTADDF